MKSHHHQPAAWAQKTLRRLETTLELTQLVVHRNSQGLEGSGRGIARPLPPTFGTRHDRGERSGGGNGRHATRGYNSPSHRSRLGLVAVHEQQPRQRAFVHPVDQIRSGRSDARHAHVERTLGLERETALRFIQLEGGNAKVENDTVDGNNTQCRQPLLHGPEGCGDHSEGHLLTRQRPAALDSFRITIEADHPTTRYVEDRTSVATAAERGVDLNALILRLQGVQYFRQKNRSMSHAANPLGELSTRGRLNTFEAACQRC